MLYTFQWRSHLFCKYAWNIHKIDRTIDPSKPKIIQNLLRAKISQLQYNKTNGRGGETHTHR